MHISDLPSAGCISATCPQQVAKLARWINYEFKLNDGSLMLAITIVGYPKCFRTVWDGFGRFRPFTDGVGCFPVVSNGLRTVSNGFELFRTVFGSFSDRFRTTLVRFRTFFGRIHPF